MKKASILCYGTVFAHLHLLLAGNQTHLSPTTSHPQPTTLR